MPRLAQLNELFQETQIAFIEQAQVIDAIAQHGQPLQPGAEREADGLLGIEAHVADHGRMHLAGAGNLQPAALERPAAKSDINFGGRFGEWKIGWAETDLQVIRLEKRLDEIQVYTLEV